MRTLLVDVTAKPVMLVPTDTAVARLAQAIADKTPGYETLVAHPTRRYRSQHLDVAAPLVLMTPYYVELGAGDRASISRRVLFARDRYACQYCDFVATGTNAQRSLTVDHVKPARLFTPRERANTWDNVTTACRECNQRKGGRLPHEAKMMPRTLPREPHYVQLRFAGRLAPAQRDYVRTYFRWDEHEMPM